MQNIYYEVIEKVQNGAKFQVDFQQRSLKIDGKYIIKNRDDRFPKPKGFPQSRLLGGG